MSINQAIIVGRLGGDVELRWTPSGKAVANFSMATTEKRKKDDETKEVTTWHKIVAWGKTAELCNQYLSKGSQCAVVGKITTRSYDANDGTKKYITEIVAKEVQFLSVNTNQSQAQNTSQNNSYSGDMPM